MAPKNKTTEATPAPAAEGTAPAAEPKAAKAPRGPAKSYIKVLKSGKDTLSYVANATKDGKAKSYVSHRVVGEKDGKPDITIARGGTTEHESLDAAKKASEDFVKAALAQGWEAPKPAVAPGFVQKPDSFSLANLPKPKAAQAQA
jgi:hypothetical protein